MIRGPEATIIAPSDNVRYGPQTLTTAQEAQARANLGFADNFTTAQLNAFDATTSKRLAFAFCTDCINSGSQVAGAVGTLVRWSEASQRWMTFEDNVPITTDFMQWAVWMHLRNRTPQVANPFAHHITNLPLLFSSISNTTSGVAGTFNPSMSGTMDMLGFQQVLQSGAGIGSILIRLSQLNQTSGNGSFSASLRRSMAMVGTVSTFTTSVSGLDNAAFRFGLQTEETAATAWPNTFCGFVFDDTNAWTTPGASSALRYVVRVNGTDIVAPTTIGVSGGTNVTVNANALMVATVEPVSTTTARFRIGYQLADGSFTIVDAGVQSISGAPIADFCPQAHLAANKTAGLTTRRMNFARLSMSSIVTAGNMTIPYRPNFSIA